MKRVKDFNALSLAIKKQCHASSTSPLKQSHSSGEYYHTINTNNNKNKNLNSGNNLTTDKNEEYLKTVK